MMGTRMRGAIGALLVALLVTGCGDEPATDRSGAQGGEAAGEVLGGTISDDMLPLESLRSQSPPVAAPTGIAGSTTGQTADGAEEESGTTETDGANPEEAEPARADPAPEPVPEG